MKRIDPMLDTKHIKNMKLALKQARRAFEADEVPVGAIIIDEKGKIISRAYNQVEHKKSQGAHAEVLAISRAGKKSGDWRLEKCWIYVTLEPCSMCLHLILLSRMEGLVFGAQSPLFGYHLDKVGTLSIYKNKHLPLTVLDAVCADESSQLLQNFFTQKRKKSG